MRGQAAIEFLLDFLIVLGALGILLAILQGMAGRAAETQGAYRATLETESEARALDVFSSSFARGRMDVAGYYIENHHLRKQVGVAWVETETLYGDFYADQEPV